MGFSSDSLIVVHVFPVQAGLVGMARPALINYCQRSFPQGLRPLVTEYSWYQASTDFEIKFIKGRAVQKSVETIILMGRRSPHPCHALLQPGAAGLHPGRSLQPAWPLSVGTWGVREIGLGLSYLFLQLLKYRAALQSLKQSLLCTFTTLLGRKSMGQFCQLIAKVAPVPPHLFWPNSSCWSEWCWFEIVFRSVCKPSH